MAAAPAFNINTLLNSLFRLISNDIVIDDKASQEKARHPGVNAATIEGIVRARSGEQLHQARGFLEYIITRYLRAGGRFVLSAKEPNDDIYTFTPARDGFNRIVLVDYENARMGLQGAPSIAIQGNVNTYIYNLARSDTNALYIIFRTVNPGNGGRFYKAHRNIIECNIDFHPPASAYGINYNETDDFVMLTFLKLLVDKQQEMFGQELPVYVISADNYSWFTPKNVLQANLPHSQGRTYPYLVYYSPILGGQWCYYRSANTNTRKQIPVGRFTEHQNQGSRKNNSNRFYRSLGQGNYYNAEVFPAQNMLAGFVSSPIRPTHPVSGDICHLRKKIDAARAIPPGYEEESPGSDVFIYNHPDGTLCKYNTDTGEFNPNIPICDTWTDPIREDFERHYLGPSGMTQHGFMANQAARRKRIRNEIAAEKARVAEARVDRAAQRVRADALTYFAEARPDINPENINSDMIELFRNLKNLRTISFNNKSKSKYLTDKYLNNFKLALNDDTNDLILDLDKITLPEIALLVLHKFYPKEISVITIESQQESAASAASAASTSSSASGKQHNTQKQVAGPQKMNTSGNNKSKKYMPPKSSLVKKKSSNNNINGPPTKKPLINAIL